MAINRTFYMSNIFKPDLELVANPTLAGIQLKLGKAPGLQWTLADTNVADEKKLSTTYLQSPYCLDILNTDRNKTTPGLVSCSNVSSQQWKLTQAYNQTQRLSNKSTGDGLYLNTYDQTFEAFMGPGFYSGQDWMVVFVDNAQSGTPPVQNQTQVSSTPTPSATSVGIKSSGAPSAASSATASPSAASAATINDSSSLSWSLGLPLLFLLGSLW